MCRDAFCTKSGGAVSKSVRVCSRFFLEYGNPKEEAVLRYQIAFISNRIYSLSNKKLDEINKKEWNPKIVWGVTYKN